MQVKVQFIITVYSDNNVLFISTNHSMTIVVIVTVIGVDS